jgi:hypothetical protein
MKFPPIHPAEWGIAGVLFGTIAVIAVAARWTASPLSAGPMLQDATAGGFTVVWWQSGRDAAELRISATGADATFPAGRNGNRCEARATGLLPGTSYHYEILAVAQNGSRRPLADGQAQTAPLPGNPFTFLMFADSGSGHPEQYDLAQIMNRYPRDLVLHAGDLIYGCASPRGYLDKFFHPYRGLLRDAFFYPVLGNHDLKSDAGRTFLDMFSLPTNGPAALPPEHCYWFDYGDARFIGLDSNLDPQTLAVAVIPWLSETLAAADRRWKFIFFHHAPWAGGNRPANAKVCDILVPAIEAGGANVVFCGHNHLYERMRPLRNGQIVPASTGVLYVTSAAGGKSLQAERQGDRTQIAVFDDTQFSFTWVQVDANRVVIEQIGAGNDVLDRVVLEPPAAH